jgi:peroxiredoxin (alkyl hydroperoxide reductase subunit C)
VISTHGSSREPLNQTITNKYRLLTNNGLSFPGVFIIDKERIIQYYTMDNLLCGRSINELLRILKSIQSTKKNPGYACPVNWKYGDQILYSHPLKPKVYFKISYSNKEE